MENNPTCCVIEPQRFIREAVVALLEAHGISAVTFSEQEMSHRSETIIVMNVSSLNAVAEVQKFAQAGSCVIGYGRPMTAALALRSFDAGATAILSDTEGIAALLDCIAGTRRGVSDPRLLAAVSFLRQERAAFPRLTPRETAVLEGISIGLTPAELAEKWNVSRTTIGNHLQRALVKLGVSNRNAAVRTAEYLGMIETRR
jgi:DNA-binding NarL/FixJ family response regulator